MTTSRRLRRSSFTLVYLHGAGYFTVGGMRVELYQPMFVPGLEPYDEINFKPRPLLPTAYVKRRGQQLSLTDAEQHAIETKLRRIANALNYEIDRRQGVDRRVSQLPWTGPERRIGSRRATDERSMP